MQYFYTAYGLTFASGLELPALPAVAAGVPDVTIRCGPVPRKLNQPLDIGVCFQADHDHFLLKVDQVAHFLAVAGKEIVVEPCGDAAIDDVQTFLLGPLFGALLLQRGYLVLRGAAVVFAQQAVMFSGNAAIGKSTLAAAFYKKGCQVLSDDLCAVRFTPAGLPEIIPGLPRLKLWADAVASIGENSGSLQRVRSGLEKYELPLQEYFCPEALPLYRVYNLQTHSLEGLGLQETEGMNKLEILLQNRYRSRLLAGPRKALSLQQCATVARAVAVCRLSRPKTGTGIEAMTACIEMDLGI